MNGSYFDRLERQPLPPGARSSSPRPRRRSPCSPSSRTPLSRVVLTETSNPQHMEENAKTTFAPVPDFAARETMRAS